MTNAYQTDAGAVAIALNQDKMPNQYAPALQQLGEEAGNATTVGQQDFSDVDEKTSTLSSLAQAFHQMALDGSPVLKAQQNIQNGQTARAAASAQNYNQLSAVGAQGGQQAVQAAGQDQQQMQGQAQGMNNQVLSANLQKTAIQMQLTHAAAQETIQKQKLQSTADLSAAATLTAQQQLIQNGTNDLNQTNLGESQINYNDWMKGIGIATNLGSQAAAVGSQLGSNTGTPNSVNDSNPANTDDQGAGSFGNNEPNANYTGPDQGGTTPDDTGSYGAN